MAFFLAIPVGIIISRVSLFEWELSFMCVFPDPKNQIRILKTKEFTSISQ